MPAEGEVKLGFKDLKYSSKDGSDSKKNVKRMACDNDDDDEDYSDDAEFWKFEIDYHFFIK